MVQMIGMQKKLKSLVLAIWLAHSPVLIAQEDLSNAVSASKDSTFKDSTSKDDVDQIIDKMSTIEKAGQFFCVGFPQQDLSPELKKFIKEFHPGAFVLFGRNVKNLNQVKQFNLDLTAQYPADLPPLIAVDEEGGNVTRIPTRPPLPSALSLGQSRSLSVAKEFGKETGRILSSLGFSMNLAPVLDVANPTRKSFIGVRSFGGNAYTVGKIGTAVAVGLLESNIIPTAKHFPGTGSSVHDPHKFAIKKSATKDQLQNEIDAFKDFIDLSPPTAIMISHLKYPALDSSELPATYSKKIIKDLLREEFNYKGLVLTDDLQMTSAKGYGNADDAALRAISAGADLVMITWSLQDQKSAMRKVASAIENGQLPEAAVRASLRRIINTKKFLKIKQNPISKISSNNEYIHSSILNQLNWKIMTMNLNNQVGMTQKSRSAPPLIIKPSLVCVFSSHEPFNLGFAKTYRQNAKYFSLIDQGQKKLEKTIEEKSCDLSVIAILGYKTSLQAQSLTKKIKISTLVVNMAGPFVLPEPEQFGKVVNLYFPHFGAGEFIGTNLDQIMLPK